MATAEQYVADSDDEMGPDTSGDEVDGVEEVVLTPQEWKAKAGDLYKVRERDPLRWVLQVSYPIIHHTDASTDNVVLR